MLSEKHARKVRKWRAAATLALGSGLLLLVMRRVGHSVVNRRCCLFSGRMLHQCVINALSLSDLAFSLPRIYQRKSVFSGPGSDVLWCHGLWARGVLMGTLIGDE